MAAQPRRLSLVHENDFVRHTDRNYTSGVLLSETVGRFEGLASNPCASAWSRSMASWLNRLPDESLRHRQFAFGIGQQLFTPEDYRATAVVPNDRPYAGWLFVRWTLQAQNDWRSQTYALDLGMVGPAAFGEPAQNFFHTLEGYPKYQGWGNQLRNEFAGQLTGEWRRVLWRSALAVGSPGTASRSTETRTSGSALDPSSYVSSVIGHFGLALGTVETYANAGLQWRYGPITSRDTSLPATMRSGAVLRPIVQRNEYSGLQLFAALDVRAVARNLFLDGNLRAASHSVERRPVVAELSAGLAWRWAWADLLYSHTLRTREFEGQTYNHVFGSLTISANLH